MQQGHHFFRSRGSGGLPRFPSRWKRTIDRAVYFIAVIAPFSYAPQAYKLFVERDADGLALSSFVILFFINGLWLLYGWAHRSTPLVVTSILFCIFHIIIVTEILLF